MIVVHYFLMSFLKFKIMNYDQSPAPGVSTGEEASNDKTFKPFSYLAFEEKSHKISGIMTLLKTRQPGKGMLSVKLKEGVPENQLPPKAVVTEYAEKPNHVIGFLHDGTTATEGHAASISFGGFSLRKANILAVHEHETGVLVW